MHVGINLQMHFIQQWGKATRVITRVCSHVQFDRLHVVLYIRNPLYRGPLYRGSTVQRNRTKQVKIQTGHKYKFKKK